MNAEKNAIRLLATTALLLLLALMFVPSHATGEVSVVNGDYSIATFPTSGGNDAVYIADTRNGMFGIFGVDPTTRQIAPRANVMRLDDAVSGR